MGMGEATMEQQQDNRVQGREGNLPCRAAPPTPPPPRGAQTLTLPSSRAWLSLHPQAFELLLPTLQFCSLFQ